MKFSPRFQRNERPFSCVGNQVVTAQVVWKYTTMEHGEQSAMMIGIITMPTLCAVSLGIKMRLRPFDPIQFLMVLGRYG